MSQHTLHFELAISCFGTTKQVDGGVVFENGSRLLVEEDLLRVVIVPGTGLWVKRGDGRNGWLVATHQELSEAQIFATTLLSEDLYVVGDADFWQKTPEEILEEPSGLPGNGAIVHISKRAEVEEEMRVPVPAMAHTMQTDRPTTDLPFRAKARGLKDFVSQRLPHRAESTDFVVHGGDDVRPVRRKRLMITGIAALVLVGALTGVGSVRRAQIERGTNSQNKTIETIVASYREAKAIVSMDPQRSRSLLSDAQVAMGSLTGEYATDPRLDEVKSGMGAVLGEATGTQNIEGTVLIDLHLLREGMKGQYIVFGDEMLWVMDKDGGRLVAVKPDTGAGEVKFSQATFGTPQLMASYPGKLYILSDKGIVECTIATAVCKTVVEKDSEWGTIVGMGVWAGNIYMLDTAKTMIWKYAVTDSGFSNRQEWLDADESLSLRSSLAGAKGFTIDGNLWTMENGLALIKYTRGVGERITLSELDAPLGKSLDLYTTDEIENIYILDRDNGRVVEINKGGVYLKQWQNETMKAATGFVVDEKSNRLWWVAGQNVWSATLVK